MVPQATKEYGNLPTRLRWLRSPLAWLIIGSVLLFVVGGVFEGSADSATGMGRLWLPVVGAAVLLPLYWALMRFAAGRAVTEFPRSRALPDTLLGVGIGGGLRVVALLILPLLGALTAHGTELSWWSVVWPVLVFMAFTAIYEELVFRGALFQGLEQLAGSWVALVVSAVIFGLVHVPTAHVSLPAAVMIVIQGGLLLGAAFLFARNLWLPIGLHFGWNATEDILFGDPDEHKRGLLDISDSGPAWLTGGADGTSSSIITVLLGLAITAALLIAAHRRGHIVPRPHRSTLTASGKRRAHPA